MVNRLIGMPLYRYAIMYIRLIAASLVVWFVMYISVYELEVTLLKYIASALFVIMLIIISYAIMVFEKNDIIYVYNFVIRRFEK